MVPRGRSAWPGASRRWPSAERCASQMETVSALPLRWRTRPGSSPASAIQSRISTIGEAQPAMGMLAAKRLDPMRGEIDDDQPSLGPQHAGGLGNDRGRPLGEMQHLMDRDGIEGMALPGQGVHIAMADVTRAKSAASGADACAVHPAHYNLARNETTRIRAADVCRQGLTMAFNNGGALGLGDVRTR